MPEAHPTVVVTGISGNLGQRLLAQLPDHRVIGVDLLPPPSTVGLDRFVPLDLGYEASTRELVQLFKETQPVAVVHLAFVLDPVRNGVLDVDTMWRINVAGTSRVMEAISDANRERGSIATFLYPSSVSAYGPDLPEAVNEDFPLGAHTLPYAIHKRQADQVVQARAASLLECSAFILRPHIFTGSTVHNYMVGAFRGTANGQSAYAHRMVREGRRLPCVLPMGQQFLNNRMQFVHVDDMARLLAFLLRRIRLPEPPVTIFNVTGRGEPLTFARCIEIAQAKLIRVPNRWTMKLLLEAMWKMKISAIPPEALPYMTGEYLMDTSRLEKYLDYEYPRVIRYSMEDAYADCFADMLHAEEADAHAATRA